MWHTFALVLDETGNLAKGPVVTIFVSVNDSVSILEKQIGFPGQKVIIRLEIELFRLRFAFALW